VHGYMHTVGGDEGDQSPEERERGMVTGGGGKWRGKVGEGRVVRGRREKGGGEGWVPV
jgi:hypothetical protein